MHTLKNWWEVLRSKTDMPCLQGNKAMGLGATLGSGLNSECKAFLGPQTDMAANSPSGWGTTRGRRERGAKR